MSAQRSIGISHLLVEFGYGYQVVVAIAFAGVGAGSGLVTDMPIVWLRRSRRFDSYQLDIGQIHIILIIALVAFAGSNTDYGVTN